ncbi:MAG: RDD family protein [Gemmatimonadota bacterium]
MVTRPELRDPRSIITPDAFQLDPSLLGRPLATPRRRFFAMLVDLVVIGGITFVTRNFALILGVLATALFIRMSLKRTPETGSVFNRAMRFSLGCLGMLIGLVTLVAWLVVGSINRGGLPEGIMDINGVDFSEAGSGPGALGRVAQLVTGGVGLAQSSSLEEATDAMAALVEKGRALDVPTLELREVILEFLPQDADWRPEAESTLETLLAAAEGGGPDSAPAAADFSASPSAGSGAVASPSGSGTQSASGAPEADADALLALPQVADTLTELEARIAELEALSARRLTTIRELRAALAEGQKDRGILAGIISFGDDLGFGFGWATLYLTVLLTVLRGQTVGKRLMGIRVLRLDGKPITWWTAFERAGGYAAGLATGLLGFAQIWWDANRQAIHDRIVGTVVVVDGAKPVADWRAGVRDQAAARKQRPQTMGGGRRP